MMGHASVLQKIAMRGNMVCSPLMDQNIIGDYFMCE